MTRDEIVRFGRRIYLTKIGRGGTLREDEPIPSAPMLSDADFHMLATRLAREATQDDRDALVEGFKDPFGGPPFK